MKVLITGGAGFLGRRLAARLLQRGTLKNAELREEKIDQITLFDVVPALGFNDPRINVVTADVGDADALSKVIDEETTSVFHLAAVVSRQAEDDFDLGLSVNIDASRQLFETCRKVGHNPKLVFASSLAVYGGALPEVVQDDTVLQPKTSFGVQKAIIELLLSDYRRRGFIDGRVLRLPTIAVRPGKPNKAASSFTSSIIREPLNNVQTVCPVTMDMKLWLMSPRQAIECLIHGHNLGAEAFGQRHVLNLPGVTVSVREMVDVLGKIAGEPATRLIRWEPDPAIQRIIHTWPTRWDMSRAHMLGFKGDQDFESIVRAFIKDDLVG
ncbi:D-erythronate dehydrogenase [Propionivibrio sp.]|uniref:D-erythronate dehydrogenase n=1 Tax=Propionivibrio sp. TaxID=2212460 RepID=UPI00272E5FA4|nr:D-erythronate dehydrogenase [Propionivibrio sp.]